MSIHDVRIEVRIEDLGEGYRDDFVIEKVVGDRFAPRREQYREGLWRGREGELWSIVQRGRRQLRRYNGEALPRPFLWRHRESAPDGDIDMLLLPVPGNSLPDSESGETTIVTWDPIHDSGGDADA